jgi:pimeloyl-ACP methyl ester carboxylesterase
VQALHVDDIGTGEPVLLIHSSGFSGRQWRHLAGELVTHGKRAIVPDLTGHGRSPAWPEPEPFSFHIDVDQVRALLAAIGPAHVVGHSYGGLVALHVALVAGPSVRSLTLFDPVAFSVLDPAADRDARAELDAIDLRWGDPERWLRAFVDFWGGAGAWEGLREPVRTEFLRVAWVVHEGVRTLMADTTPLATYQALACPTLVLTGERSPLPARKVDERLAATIPGARLEVIANAGHLAPVTEPVRVDAVIAAAIDAVGESGRS